MDKRLILPCNLELPLNGVLQVVPTSGLVTNQMLELSILDHLTKNNFFQFLNLTNISSKKSTISQRHSVMESPANHHPMQPTYQTPINMSLL